MEMCYDGVLIMPSSYAVMNDDEMTYVEGGFYIKYSTIRAVVLASCLNPIGATLVGIGCYKLAGLITAKAAILGGKIGSLGGPVVSAISAAVSAVIGAGAALTIAHAVIQKKGIGVDLVYSRWGVPYWVNINVR